MDPGAVPGIGTQGPAQGLRAPGAGRKLAGAGDHRAALSLPARGHAAPGLPRARVVGRRDGPRQDHPGDRRVRASTPARPGRARAHRHAGLAQDRMGGADPAVYSLALPDRLRRAEGAAPGLWGCAVFYHRQLRADGQGRAHRQCQAQAGYRGPGRGATDQELEHADGAGDQAPAEPLCVRADRYAHREPHR